MRVFNPAIQGEIDKHFAGEPMVLIEVEWDGLPIAYTDRKLNDADYPYPYLAEITPFDNTQIVSGGSDTQQTTITLNDIDGTLRTLCDTHDIHLKPVRVYLTFQGLPLAEKALMFEGVINSPIVWDEGGRTLTFDVLSKIESVEAGFMMEDGDFPYIRPEDRNKPWPLVFGQICNMEAVQVRGLRKGFLAEGVGVKDPTIEERLCQAYKLKCSVANNLTSIDGSVGDGDGLGIFGGMQYNNVRNGKEDNQCLKRRWDKICEILTEKAQQEQYVKSQFTVRGGTEFPQGQKITILINEVRFEGSMAGEVFTVTQVFHPDPKDNPPCVDTPPAAWGYRHIPSGTEIPTIAGCASGAGSSYDQQIVGGGGASWRYFNEFERSNFIWLPPGSAVYLADESELLNIVSLIPGTVNQVAAYRNYSDTSLLMAVDTDRYTVVTTNFGGYQVVEVRLDAPLSTIEDEDWDDEIYVSFTSTVGPNPADIIKWLVEAYTDLTMDVASYNSVKADLADYPSNFFVKARPRVLDLIHDVAFQARCATYIRNNIVYLVYLSKEPTSVKTLTASDILPNTFRISHTDTEDLETRHKITWSDGEAGIYKEDPTEYEFVLKHNIPKYGVFDVDYDYYTMNIFELVEKSATFWTIRNSNTWKLVEFETPLTMLNLDVFDAITINYAPHFSCKCVITESKFNIDTNTISFKAWTPVRSGESSEYYWAWPNQKPTTAIHPLPGDESELGDDYSQQVIPPVGHPLRGSYDPDTAILNTQGDRYPSDLDDTFPTVECKIATGAEIADDIEPEFDAFEPLAESNFADKLDGIEAGNVDASDEEDAEEKTACGDPIVGDSGCIYEVSVTYVTSAAVTSRDATGSAVSALPKCYGPCGCNTQGKSCYGPMHTFCHTFGALFAATSFSSQKRMEAGHNWGNCVFECGKPMVVTVGGITAIPSEGMFGSCESIPGNLGDPTAPGADAGQTQKPKFKHGSSNPPAAGDLQ